MSSIQTELEMTTLHVRKVEARLATQRAKIAVMRALGRQIDAEDQALRELERSLEYLKGHLADISAPDIMRKAS